MCQEHFGFYKNFDAFYLPTSGTSANIEMRVKNYRKGNLENFVSLFGNYEKYFLLFYDWVARFGFSGATLLPTGNVFANDGVDIKVTYSAPSDPTAGDITVSMEADISFFTPVLSTVLGKEKTITSTVIMKVES